MRVVRDIESLSAVLAIVAKKIEADMAATLRTLAVYDRGFPSQAAGAGVGTGSGGTFSPTEALALRGPDQVEIDRERLARALDQALSAARVAEAIVAKYRVPERVAHDPADIDVCVSCHRDREYLTLRSPHYAQLCRWCGDFTAHYGQAPPVSILRDRHDGRRITERQIMAALQREGQQQRGA